MKSALLIFAATYVSVFTLGLQSLNVNQGHYLAAAVTSFFIGTGHILLYRLMPQAHWVEYVGYYAGGIAGITASIWFHKRAKAWLSAWLERRRAARGDAAKDEHRDVEQCGRIQPATCACYPGGIPSATCSVCPVTIGQDVH